METSLRNLYVNIGAIRVKEFTNGYDVSGL